MNPEIRRLAAELTRVASNKKPPLKRPPRYGRMVYEEATGGDPDNMRALQAMRQLWTFGGGYYPGGGSMPAPEFSPEFGVPHARVNEGEGWIGVTPQMARALGRQKRMDNDDAEETLIHEWAHAHQSPEVLADLALREGAAEAFTLAVAPVVARRAGRRRDGDVYEPRYVKERQRALARGPSFILRKQFRHG